MKKLLLLIPVVALLAAACNSPQQATVQTPPVSQTSPSTQTQTKQNTNQPDYAPSSTSDATASWKTYTDAQYGVEFKYPANYTVTKTPEGKDKFATFSVDHLAGIIYPSTLSLDAYIQDAVHNQGTLSSYQKINFAGQPAYEGIDGGMTTAYVIYLKNKAYVFRLVLNTNNTDTLPELKAGLTTEQNQILSTFKFTK